MPAQDERRAIVIVLYPRFTALDAIGPYEVLARLPGFRTVFVAETLTPVLTDRGLRVLPDATFDDAPEADVLLVPGGPGQFDRMDDRPLLDFLRKAAVTAEHVTSVCTGSLLLAAAGLLDRRQATTHWLARDALGALGAVPVAQRVVEDGNVMTGSGVSAGIDLALVLAARLAGDDVAQMIQLGIEYDPQPPFAAGSPDTAPAAIVERLRANARQYLM